MHSNFLTIYLAENGLCHALSASSSFGGGAIDDDDLDAGRELRAFPAMYAPKPPSVLFIDDAFFDVLLLSLDPLLSGNLACKSLRPSLRRIPRLFPELYGCRGSIRSNSATSVRIFQSMKAVDCRIVFTNPSPNDWVGFFS